MSAVVSEEVERTPARVVLRDIPVPEHDGSSTLTVYQRGDILPLELTGELPDDALSPELHFAEGDKLFLLYEFDHDHFENITVIPVGPPGSPRRPLDPEKRALLDEYADDVGPKQFRRLVLRPRDDGMYVNTFRK